MAIPRRSRKAVSQQSISWSPDTLIRDMEQLRIYYDELDKVHEYQLKSRYEELNKRSAERAARDAEQLAASQARREAIQKEADAVLQSWVREQEEKAERERQIEAARVAAEQKAKAEAEAKARREREETEARERAQREETARVEEQARQRAAAAKQAAEEKKALEAAEALKRQQEEEDAAKAEAARKDEAEAQKKQQQQQQEQEQAQQQQLQTTIPTTTPQAPTSDQAAKEALHARYLAIHARLKTFRSTFWTSAKADPALKNKVGDMRRALRTSVGQLIEGKGVNTQPTQRVKAVFQQALSLPSPPIDIRDYLASPPPSSTTSLASGWQVPSLLIWTLSIFAKAIIAQFTTESGVSTHTAEPTGILLVQILSVEEFQFKSPGGPIPMVDILLAKYHAACPVLWGIYGPESTAAGKRRLGWRIEERNGQRGFVPDQQHYDRMNGLGAGYAAIALRNFSKTKLRNPYPPFNFWESLAGIVNVPPEQVTTTHLVVLRSMLENCTERFLMFFGNVGVAALRLALVEFPARLPEGVRQGAACKAVGLLIDKLRTERRFNVV